MDSCYLNLLFFHSGLQKLDSDRFFKLKTEIEIVEVYKNIINENIESTFSDRQTVQKHLQYWIHHQQEKHFTVIKVMDNSQSQLIFRELISQPSTKASTTTQLNLLMSLLKQLVFEYNTFIFSFCKDNGGECVLYKDPLLQEQFKMYSEVSKQQINQVTVYSQFFYLIPSFLFHSDKINPVKICKISNCLNLANTITQKYIRISDMYYLQSLATKLTAIEKIFYQVTSFLELIVWERMDDLDLLLTTLSSQATYQPEKQEFKTQEDYFSNPSLEEKAELIKSLFEASSVNHISNEIIQSQIKDQSSIIQVEIITIFSSRIKELLLFVQINEIPLLDVQLLHTLKKQILKDNKKSSISFVQITCSCSLEKLVCRLVEFLDENKHQFKNNQKQNQIDDIRIQRMIGKGTELFINIQQNLKESIKNLTEEEKTIVSTNFKKLLIQSFLIEKV